MVLVLKEYPNGSAGSAAGDLDGRAEAATAAVDMASTSRRERVMAGSGFRRGQCKQNGHKKARKDTKMNDRDGPPAALAVDSFCVFSCLFVAIELLRTAGRNQ